MTKVFPGFLFPSGGSGSSFTPGAWAQISGPQAVPMESAVTMNPDYHTPRKRALSPLRSISQAYREADLIGSDYNKPAPKWHPVVCQGNHMYGQALALMPRVCIHCDHEEEEVCDGTWQTAEITARDPAQAPDTGNGGAAAAQAIYGARAPGGYTDKGTGPAEVKAGEIVAWRIWKVDPNRDQLYSATRDTNGWLPGVPMQGLPDKPSEGVYASKTRDYVARLANHGPWMFAIGKVAMWGKVIEHEWGYRAEYAQVVEITNLSMYNPALLHRLRCKYTPIGGFPEKKPATPPPLPPKAFNPFVRPPKADYWAEPKTTNPSDIDNDIDEKVIAKEARRDAIRALARRTERARGRFESWPSAFGYKDKG